MAFTETGEYVDEATRLTASGVSLASDGLTNTGVVVVGITAGGGGGGEPTPDPEAPPEGNVFSEVDRNHRRRRIIMSASRGVR